MSPAPATTGPILLLETSGPACSVAIGDLATGALLAEVEDPTPMRHTARLLPLIRAAFAKTPYALSDTRAVAVSEGPGSYTALRAGLSTAKGLCLALDVPLVLVPTLEALARAMRAARPAWTGPWLAVLEARRAEVYAARYGPDLAVLAAPACVTADAPWLAEQVRAGAVAIGGSGAEKVTALVALGETPTRLERVAVGLHAANLLEPSLLRLREGQVADLASAVPSYLRPPHLTQAKSRL